MGAGASCTLSPAWAPAPVTLSLAVTSSSPLSVVCWSSPQRGERSCLVLKPLPAGQTRCWSCSPGRWFSQAQGRTGCPSPSGSVPTLPSDTFHVFPGKKGDSGRVTQEEQAHYWPEHTHWDLSAWACEAGPGWEHPSDSWGKGHIPARHEGKLEKC